MPSEEFKDDLTISDITELWRRIHPEQVFQDENLGRWRPSSAAFRDFELSVALSDAGRTAQEVIAKYPHHWLASISANLARSNSQRILRQPTPDEPAHGLVVGKKSGQIRDTFAKKASWVIFRV